jgi:hypothetical protein
MGHSNPQIIGEKIDKILRAETKHAHSFSWVFGWQITFFRLKKI